MGGDRNVEGGTGGAAMGLPFFVVVDVVFFMKG